MRRDANDYDTFISYRRDHGSELAQLVYRDLFQRGFEVFLDVRKMKSDDTFDNSLLRAIEASRCFLLVVTPGCFDRCSSEADWLRQEIRHALQSRKQILQLRTENAAYPRCDELPPDIREITRWHCFHYSNHHCDESLDKIRLQLQALGHNPFLDEFQIFAPSISSVEAVDAAAKSAFRDDGIAEYELIDLVGSYYICLQIPGTIFHRPCGWRLVYRHRKRKNLLEINVRDSRVPSFPNLPVPSERLEPGWITYFATRTYPDHEHALLMIDEEGRVRISTVYGGPPDSIGEVWPNERCVPIARILIGGGPADSVQEYIESASPISFGITQVKRADLDMNPFHGSLAAIGEFRVSAERAIQLARQRGARGMVPGSERVGGPGVIRLNSCWPDEVDPPSAGRVFWEIPYRIGIRPVRIDADDGRVLALNDEFKYSTEW